MAKHKVTYLGAPATFSLDLAVGPIAESFDAYGCYLVGSVLETPDFRDVDIRMIMSDEAFGKEFPNAKLHSHAWEHDPKWLLLTTAISEYLARVTGLPIDFQFHPASAVNAETENKRRQPIGIRIPAEESGE